MFDTTQHRAKQTIEAMSQTADPVTKAMSLGLMNQDDLARLSGLNTKTLRAIQEGKRATKAQLAALTFAAIRRIINV